MSQQARLPFAKRPLALADSLEKTLAKHFVRDAKDLIDCMIQDPETGEWFVDDVWAIRDCMNALKATIKRAEGLL